MEDLRAVIVDVSNDSVKCFNGNEITFGRNRTNSFDIPDRIISRNQCVVKRTDGNQWILQDLSSQKSTLLNGHPVEDPYSILSNGDKISFRYCPFEFLFYEGLNQIPSIFKKRKTDDNETCLFSPPNKVLKPSEDPDEKEESDVLTPEDFASSTQKNEINSLNNELRKFKMLYETTLSDLYKVKKDFSSVNLELKDLQQKTVEKQNDLKVEMQLNGFQMDVMKKEKEILLKKLTEEEAAREKMILELQSLTECLKDCEEEKNRLLEESEQKDLPKESLEKPIAKSAAKDYDDDDVFSPSALQSIVNLVEAKWHEGELKQLKFELNQQTDKITDLTLEAEKRRLELMELIDKELLCSICSEMLYNAVTLNCMHSFCKACLKEWKDKKKECPVCRTKIKLEIHPLVVDSFIDKLCEWVGGDLKSRREEVRAERSKLPNRHEDSDDGRGTRGNGRRRNSTPRRRRNYNVNLRHAADPYPGLYNQLVVDLSNARPVFPGGIIDLTTSPQSRRSSRLHMNNNNHGTVFIRQSNL